MEVHCLFLFLKGSDHMEARNQSAFGYIMNYTNTPTVQMAQALHIDASLVSKWKTGARNLSAKSIYFADVVDFFISLNTEDENYTLKDALLSFYPLEDLSNDTSLRATLIKILTHKNLKHPNADEPICCDKGTETSAWIYDDDEGQRAAISSLLDMAEAMNIPGELTFAEADSFIWMIHDEAYASEFCQRMISLLNKGFHAKFILQYSDSKEDTLSFFKMCHQLIFHRNIEWFYYDNYNKPLVRISFYMLNSALSILCMSSCDQVSQSCVYVNSSVILKHQELVRKLLDNCHHLFRNYKLLKFVNVVNDIYQFRKRGAVYAILSAPAFIAVEPDLMQDVLKANHVSKDKIALCLDINSKFREKTNHTDSSHRNSLFYIFRLESMIRRTMMPFISTSLSLLCDQPIHVDHRYYAQALRNIGNSLLENDSLNVVLVTNSDKIQIPKVNCWCNQNSWIFQMDTEGFRLSDEPSIVGAISSHIERGMALIPSDRKERHSVSRYLYDFASEIDDIE